MDPNSDPTTLPELSFDDLLDESPIKRFTTATLSDDPMSDKISLKDDVLHTPGVKRKINPNEEMTTQTHDMLGELLAENNLTPPTPSSSSTMSTTLQKTIIPATVAPVVNTAVKTTNAAPILLNNKLSFGQSGAGNALPQRILKIATTGGKIITTTSSAATTAGATVVTTIKPKTMGTVTTIGGKTAIKTANGQIVYLQKAPTTVGSAVGTNTVVSNAGKTTTFRLATIGANSNSNSNTSAIKSTIINAKPNVEIASPSSGEVSTKPMAIQLVRSADGKLVPLKATTAGVKNTLTLSPNVAAQLAGKKIVTATGNQVVIKAATPTQVKTVTAPTPTGATVVASATTSTSTVGTKPFKIEKIMAPSAGALPKNAWKTVLNAPIISTSATSTAISTTTTTTGTTITTTKAIVAPTTTTTTATAATAGGKFIVQSANGKQIVLPSSQLIKLSPKATNTNATSSGGTTSGQVQTVQISGKSGVQYIRVMPTAAKKPTTISEASTAAAAKLLNATPNKFNIVRSNAAGKFVITTSPKVDTTSGGQKKLVTIPTIRNINSQEIAATASGSNIQNKTGNTSSPTMVTVLRPKQKISEINSEIKRMTTTINVGPELAKKVVTSGDGKRFVVVPRTAVTNQQKVGATAAPKVIVKSGTLASGTGAGTAEGGMKSFIICKTNQNQSASSGSGENATTTTTTTTQIKKIITQQPTPPQQQQQQPAAFSQLKQPKPILDDSSSSSIGTASTSVQFSATNNSNNNNNNTNSNSNTSNANSKFVPIKIKEEILDGEDMNSGNFNDDPFARGGVRRKHCNCSKSQCLKLYCDCFANGEFCQDCTCKDCFNSLQYEDERLRAIRSCLERNPSAFKPKITSAADQGDARLHNKGCNCKRSGCLKNYCECFEAKIPCSNNCKCVGCRNVEDRPDLDMDPIDPNILETIANASNAINTIARAVSHKSASGVGSKRGYDSLNDTDNESKRRRGSQEGTAALLASTEISDDDDDDADADNKHSMEKRSNNFITQEVIDATIQCMISQADECLKNNLSSPKIEKLVIEELGRCLVEIIDFSIRNTENSFTQN